MQYSEIEVAPLYEANFTLPLVGIVGWEEIE